MSIFTSLLLSDIICVEISIKNTENMTKRNLAIILAVLVIALGAFFSYYAFRDDGNTTSENPDQTSAQTTGSSDENSQTSDNDVNENTTVDADQSGQDIPAKEDPEVNDSVTVTKQVNITNIRVENQQLVVQTKLENIVSGTCKLTIRNGSNTITRDAEVVYGAQNSICAGYSIDTSDIGTGATTVSLQVTESGTTYNSEEKTISL